eukprot:XP_001694087.1 predicted protein [Chlamydomonas reinhardtii]
MTKPATPRQRNGRAPRGPPKRVHSNDPACGHARRQHLLSTPANANTSLSTQTCLLNSIHAAGVLPAMQLDWALPMRHSPMVRLQVHMTVHEHAKPNRPSNGG